MYPFLTKYFSQCKAKTWRLKYYSSLDLSTSLERQRTCLKLLDADKKMIADLREVVWNALFPHVPFPFWGVKSRHRFQSQRGTGIRDPSFPWTFLICSLSHSSPGMLAGGWLLKHGALPCSQRAVHTLNLGLAAPLGACKYHNAITIWGFLWLDAKVYWLTLQCSEGKES